MSSTSSETAFRAGDVRDESALSVVDRATGRVDAAAEWRHPLTGLTLGLLLFETITGLAIYLLPFSVFNQFGVLWHTLIGIAMIVPVGWYLGRHWWLRFHGKFNHYQFLGYLSAVLLAALFVSGFVLTWQAAFGTRISYGWDLVHLVTGLVLIFALLAHCLILWFRKINAPEAIAVLRSSKRSFLRLTLTAACLLLVIHAGSAAMYSPAPVNNNFPADYSWKYGEQLGP